MPVELPEYCQEMLKVLPKPTNLWKYMLALTQIPRGSNMGDEMWRHIKVRDFLKKCAEEMGYETIVDAGENLIVRKPAFPGMEDKPTVCLQCHMDMVVQKNDDVEINFDTDPLTPRIVDDKWLMATGTSLGADDGAGVATCFAILEDKEMKHGPLEILVTRDEETGLFGAAGLEAGILKAKYMINVDSEEENAVCVGCAGGFTMHMKLPTPRSPLVEEVRKTIVLNNFLGGHSGCDIHLGRANPLHTMARLLKALCCPVRLIAVDCGTAHNAIPRKCVVDVAVKADKVECFEKCMKKHFEEFEKEYKIIEKEASMIIMDSKTTEEPMTAEATAAYVNFVNAFPFAVMRMSPSVAGDVETSITLAVAKNEGADHIKFIGSVRSFAHSQMDYMYNRVKSLCEMAGIELSERIGEYPGWEPNMESPLTKDLVAAYKEVTGVDPRVYAIHAGLECGLFMAKYHDLDCTSIGPTLLHPHSPDERLLIESVPRFYDVVRLALEKLAM